MPFSALAWVVRLAPRFAKIARAEVVVLMTSPTSFGPTVIGPDLLRRLYPEKRCLFIVACWRHEYNLKAALLWSDVDVVFIPRFLFSVPYRYRVISIPFVNWHDRTAEWLTLKLVAWLSRGRARFLTLLDLYGEARSWGDIPSPDSRPNGEEAISVDATTNWQLLQMSVPAPPVHLPERIQTNITPKLNRLWESFGGATPAKLCCMYLRIEKRDSHRTRLRNSSSLENHLPAVRLLNAAGYQVLLTGDSEIDAATRRDFGGGLVDASSLGIERDLYQLFAACEADIFIGNHGGGEILAMINDIPSLYLDWFPYSNGRKNAWVYFKSACDEEGRVFPGRQLITDFVYDTAASFGTLLNNTQEEITEAVAGFIEDAAHPDRPDPCADIAALIPRDTQFYVTGARISPAWVRRNFVDTGESKSA